MNDNKDIREWRKGVGGLWETVGQLQFDFLVKEGLKPNHFLLDVGCGSLRGGVFFIKYLQKGHYFGIDKNPKFLEGGKIELDENDLLDKIPVLELMDNFEFDQLNQTFHYGIAQSIFTHIEEKKIKQCLIQIDQVLEKNGKFYATFFETNSSHSLEPIIHNAIDGKITTFPNKDPFSLFVFSF